MKQEYQLLHLEMLADINRCMQLDLPEEERFEACFWLSVEYWDKLKKTIKEREFRNEDEEIDFFKNVKPRFTCYIEYFILLNGSLLFIPETKEKILTYWEGEVHRYKRFCDRHEEFLNYYRKGSHFEDKTYFLRENNLVGVALAAPPYDTELKFCTSHDPFIRSYLAYKMYAEYALNKLTSIMESENQKEN
jgi:hypothetical protein